MCSSIVIELKNPIFGSERSNIENLNIVWPITIDFTHSLNFVLSQTLEQNNKQFRAHSNKHSLMIAFKWQLVAGMKLAFAQKGILAFSNKWPKSQSIYQK